MLVITLVAAIVLVAGLDIRFELRGQRPVGEHLQTWSRRYPIYSAAFIFGFYGLLVHFFLGGS